MKRKPPHQYMIFTYLGKQVTHKHCKSSTDIFQHFLESSFAQYLGTGFLDYKVSFYWNKQKYLTSTCLDSVEEYYNEVVVPEEIRKDYEKEIEEEQRYANFIYT